MGACGLRRSAESMLVIVSEVFANYAKNYLLQNYAETCKMFNC